MAYHGNKLLLKLAVTHSSLAAARAWLVKQSCACVQCTKRNLFKILIFNHMKKLSVEQMTMIEGGWGISQRTACIGAGVLTVIGGAAVCLSGVGAMWGAVAMGAGTLGIMSC
jgi:hypothetical protein